MFKKPCSLLLVRLTSIKVLVSVILLALIALLATSAVVQPKSTIPIVSAMTGKGSAIVLIVNPRTKDRYLQRSDTAITDHNLDVDVDDWTIKPRKI